jgi:hypothetical protein
MEKNYVRSGVMAVAVGKKPKPTALFLKRPINP